MIWPEILGRREPRGGGWQAPLCVPSPEEKFVRGKSCGVGEYRGTKTACDRGKAQIDGGVAKSPGGVKTKARGRLRGSCRRRYWCLDHLRSVLVIFLEEVKDANRLWCGWWIVNPINQTIVPMFIKREKNQVRCGPGRIAGDREVENGEVSFDLLYVPLRTFPRRGRLTFQCP